MNISQESPEPHTIKSYTNNSVTVNGAIYQQSLIISPNTILTDWPVHHVQDLTEETLTPLLSQNPEIIIIGTASPLTQLPIVITQYVWSKHIGIECMSIGSASRTFNVLLSEQRVVVIGIIL